MIRVIVFTVGIGMLGLFLWMGGPALVALLLQPQSHAWPVVEGTVQTTELRITQTRGGGRTYIPVIVYTYHVNRQQYTREAVHLRSWSTPFRQDAEALLQAYVPGQTVQVSYFPSFPGYAYVERSVVEPGWVVEIVVASGWVGLSIATLILSIRMGRPRYWQTRATETE
jgi:hypothetical protein